MSGLLGAVMGYSLATVVIDDRGSKPPTTVGTAERGLRPHFGWGANLRTTDAGASSIQATAAGNAGNGVGGRKGAGDDRRAELLRDVETLRGRMLAAQKQIEVSRKRIEELEADLAGSRGPPRHKFDLAPEDWRKLGAEKVVKYRLPCNAYREPEDEVLQELGVATYEREAIRDAYSNSAERQRQTLVPLCAAALGGQLEIAKAVGVDACRHILINTAAILDIDLGESAQRIAAFMAGDAPMPDPASRNLLDDTLLVLVQESSTFERELAETFGPEDAHRIVFSDRLCFTGGIHQLGSEPSQR